MKIWSKEKVLMLDSNIINRNQNFKIKRHLSSRKQQTDSQVYQT